MADLFCLSDAQRARLERLLPQDVRGVPHVDDRRVSSGIIHVLRSGCLWSDAPRHTVNTRRCITASCAAPAAASDDACSRPWLLQAVRLSRS